MNQKELKELNILLKPPKGTEYPNQTYYQAQALPPDAKDFDFLRFINYGRYMEIENLEEELITLGYTQYENTELPNIELLIERPEFLQKPKRVKNFKFEHRLVQVIYAVDDNGPNQGDVDIESFYSEYGL